MPQSPQLPQSPQSSQFTPPHIGFISLGCAKALVDSEHILTQLRAEGYAITPHYEDADLIVVNTCGFIEAAIAESLEAIGEALKENGKVIVTGCLGAKDQIVQERYPQVLAVTGPHAYQEVLSAVKTHLPLPHHPYISLLPPQGIKLTPPHYAYLKISEGCNHRCSFCIIPQLRGDLVSRPIDEVLQEAEKLVAAGVKELLVISQDTSAYGVDLKYRTGFWQGRPLKTKLYDLAKALGEMGVWVRLHYVYPYPAVDDLIPLMAEGLILPYLDIPFQHASPTVLKAMKRPANQANVLARIKQWREICPQLALRSTFIVGFPGETAADFQQLLDFLEQAQLDRVGCFTYSAVAGADANALPNAIPEDLKLERQQQFMAVQAKISAQRLQDKIGHKAIVLIDEVNDEQIVGRSAGDAPETDGQVYMDNTHEVEVGDMIEVMITDADEHDLYAEILD